MNNYGNGAVSEDAYSAGLSSASGSRGNTDYTGQVAYVVLVVWKAFILLLAIAVAYPLRYTPSPFDQIKFLAFSLCMFSADLLLTAPFCVLNCCCVLMKCRQQSAAVWCV